MKRIGNLYEETIAVTKARPDRRFKTWVKEVTGVDQSQSNGYAFEGEFVKNSTIEYEIKPTVFLVSSTEGSMKNNSTYYYVVTMDTEGTLQATDIACDDDYHRERGWALLIRDRVTALLDGIRGDQNPEVNLDIVRQHAETVDDLALADLLMFLVEFYERNSK